MHISDVHDYDGTPHEEVAKVFVNEERKKQVKSVIEELVLDEYDRLEDMCGEHITEVAASRAERFFEKVLAGDVDAAQELFGLKGCAGRYVGVGYREGEPWMHMIHGRLFETDVVKMRRQLVESHADLLESERVKDQDAIIDGLQKQVREQDARIAELEQRVY